MCNTRGNLFVMGIHNVLTEQHTQCGYVAILGRPNVGKSTLLNRLIGTKISAVTPKPQTTRYNITGILTEGYVQILFVDTPGIHSKQNKRIDKVLNKNAISALHDVDVVLFVVVNNIWTQEEKRILNLIRDANKPCLLCVNKIDLEKDKRVLLPTLGRLAQRYTFDEIIPLSAKKGENLGPLTKGIQKYLPTAEFQFDADQISNRSERFILGELIREQLMRLTQDEIPYSIHVEMERYERDGNLLRIGAIIWVARSNHKAIVIGKGGSTLKKAGEFSRKSIEKFTGAKVFLELWVRVNHNWQNNTEVLNSFSGMDL